MGQLGFQELIIIFVIALLVFGPKKLPELGKSLGKGLREFKRATEDLKASWEDQMRDVENPLKDATKDIKQDLQEVERDMKADFYDSPEGARTSSPESTESSRPEEATVPKEKV